MKWRSAAHQTKTTNLIIVQIEHMVYDQPDWPFDSAGRFGDPPYTPAAFLRSLASWSLGLSPLVSYTLGDLILACVSLGERPAMPVRTMNRLVPLIVALLALVSGLIVFGGGATTADGTRVLGLDDSYIHLQYGWQAAQGAFLQYTTGDAPSSGATSLLYMLLLAGASRWESAGRPCPRGPDRRAGPLSAGSGPAGRPDPARRRTAARPFVRGRAALSGLERRLLAGGIFAGSGWMAWAYRAGWRPPADHAGHRNPVGHAHRSRPADRPAGGPGRADPAGSRDPGRDAARRQLLRDVAETQRSGAGDFAWGCCRSWPWPSSRPST